MIGFSLGWNTARSWLNVIPTFSVRSSNRTPASAAVLAVAGDAAASSTTLSASHAVTANSPELFEFPMSHPAPVRRRLQSVSVTGNQERQIRVDRPVAITDSL